MRLEAGSVADLTVIDPDAEWTYAREGSYSKAGNSGFTGCAFKGKATDAYVGGYATMEDGVVVE